MDKRPTVGVLFSGIHMDYTKNLMTELHKRLEEENMNVRWFVAGEGTNLFDNKLLVDKAFDLHYLTLFGYTQFEELDALIISANTIRVNKFSMELDDFLHRLQDVPKVLLGSDKKLEHAVNIVEDRAMGLYECVQYLIRERGLKKIALFSGPRGIYDFDRMCERYRRALEENHLIFSEELIIYGDFSTKENAYLGQLLDKHPDIEAVVCCSGVMTEKMYRVAKERGLTIGKDLAVCGVNDTDVMGFLDPPLSAIHLRKEELVDKTITYLKSALEGKMDLELAVIPSSFEPEQSDGTPKEIWIAKEEKLFHKRLIEMLMQNNHTLKKQNILSSMFMRNLLLKQISMQDFFERIGEMIFSLGADRSFICLLREPYLESPDEAMYVPNELSLMMYQNRQDVLAYENVNAQKVERGGFPAIYGRKDVPESVFAFPLFYRWEHYGVLCADVAHSDVPFFYGLSMQIGSALRYLYMALDQQAMYQRLQDANKVLGYSASHDGLTGLFNRLGVMQEIFQFVKKYKKTDRFVAVMADLDHLKQINDTFGHDEGDIAIRMTAKFIKRAAPLGSPLGRTGGDEFTGIFYLGHASLKDIFIKRLEDACDHYNSTANKPYYLGISVGFAEFGYAEAEEILAVLKKADMELYKAKKMRRESVIK